MFRRQERHERSRHRGGARELDAKVERLIDEAVRRASLP
jgi:hypothetical protein